MLLATVFVLEAVKRHIDGDSIGGAVFTLVACAAHADSLDERYGNKSARVRRMPNSMLQTMVDNLKAEVYEARLHLMSRATHREEELHEGDIRGSFAEGA